MHTFDVWFLRTAPLERAVSKLLLSSPKHAQHVTVSQYPWRGKGPQVLSPKRAERDASSTLPASTAVSLCKQEVWACGVLLYELVTGEGPWGDRYPAIIARVRLS